MATIDKEWNIGEGVIHLEYDGDSIGQIAVTLTSNEGIDREQNVEVQTTNGRTTESFTIKQEGLREVFACADGDFILADGGTFNVLKENVVPPQYTVLEQLDFNGHYVDTGFKPNNNTRVVMEVYADTTPSATCAFFGSRHSATANNYAFLYAGSSGLLRSDYGNVYTQTWNYPLGEVFTIDKNKETTTVKGVTYNYTNSTFQSSYNLLLFALNNAGTATWIVDSSFLFCSCQIYDNDELIRDYVPVTNGADYGLWDKVNREFIKIY